MTCAGITCFEQYVGMNDMVKGKDICTDILEKTAYLLMVLHQLHKQI